MTNKLDEEIIGIINMAHEAEIHHEAEIPITSKPNEKPRVGYGETVYFIDFKGLRKYIYHHGYGFIRVKIKPEEYAVIPADNYEVKYHRRYHNEVPEPIVRRMLIANSHPEYGHKMYKVVHSEIYDSSNINHQNANIVIMKPRKTNIP